jgi:hypothetical protein
MYGAVPYLAHAFGLDRETAFHIICEWVDLQAALEADAGAQRAPDAPRAPLAAPVAPATTNAALQPKSARRKPAPAGSAQRKATPRKSTPAKSAPANSAPAKSAAVEPSFDGTGERRRKTGAKGSGKRGSGSDRGGAVPRKSGHRAA